MPQVFTTAAQVDQLAALQDIYKTGGSEALTIHLYQNDFTPSPGMVIGDLTEADFDGYASFAMNPIIGPYLNPAGQPEIQNASHNWTPTGSTTPNTIYGYYTTQTGGGLRSAERFNDPRPMADVLDSLTLLWTLVLIPGGVSSVVQPLDA